MVAYCLHVFGGSNLNNTHAFKMEKILKGKGFIIPTLTPLLFRNNHIENKTDDLLNHENITHFFIHSFKDDDVKLSLPLPPHKKTVNDFVFITNGEMIRNLGIDSYQLNKNDFLLTPKNKITTTEFVSPDLEGFYCHFSDELIASSPFWEVLHTQPLSENFITVPVTEAENLVHLLTRVLQLYRSSNRKAKDYRLLSCYLCTILAEIFLSFKNTGVTLGKNTDVLLSFKSLAYKQFRQRTSITEYASQLNITPNYLNKIVKNETGKTTTEIIAEIVILEAKVLLLQTKLTISEIGLELGFEDASYFSRFFKKESSVSPSEFRSMIDLS